MKARVLLTHKCNRNCPNCPNKGVDFQKVPTINNMQDLLGYDQIILTGGEPMLNGFKTLQFVHQLRNILNYEKPIYLYSAYCTKKNLGDFRLLLHMLDGITYTLHYNATAKELVNLLLLTEMLEKFYYASNVNSLILNIAENIYNSAPSWFEDTTFHAWSIVNKLVYLEDCPVPWDEELIQFPIF